MDLRDLFVQVSAKLQADFHIATGASHMSVRGEVREGALTAFLGEYLPKRYSLGTGQVIASDGRFSKQCDIIIYDPIDGPRLPLGDRQALYPIEAVYGVIEVKSTLSADELRNGYANIQSVKELAPRGTFAYQMVGISAGLNRPMPFGAVFAYRAERSLDAISAQVAELDEALGANVALRPDTIVVLGRGVVGPTFSMRGRRPMEPPNQYQVPTGKASLAAVRSTGRHTLLRFYLDMMDDLAAITLETPKLRSYIDSPEWIGGHTVEQQLGVLRSSSGTWDPSAPVKKLSSRAILTLIDLVGGSAPGTYQDYLSGMFLVPPDVSTLSKQELAAPVHMYNPDKVLGPLNSLRIDGILYVFDAAALGNAIGEDPFVTVAGINAEELFAFAGKRVSR
jgi:hypothetical protein